MRIIKLLIEDFVNNGTMKIVKQAVSLDRKKCQKISDFIEFVKRLCDLKGDYVLSVDGFTFAKNDTTGVLQETNVYR